MPGLTGIYEIVKGHVPVPRKAEPNVACRTNQPSALTNDTMTQRASRRNRMTSHNDRLILRLRLRTHKRFGNEDPAAACLLISLQSRELMCKYVGLMRIH
ncbi:hypothetical protein GWI33_008485 [Rhynchophorus ferrugineus]|uniref:Uncharacterized protein n=1 Tax=Rhynchophorus ferrugineus TaxID=354439 RepID=A0A834IQX3_RHYFE|nr:hypothetical protein GWI33_008485 [Rhynchophorus ferrugineus]